MSDAAALVLSVVFVMSGGLKVFSPHWPSQARSLGAPRFIIPVLPWCELGVGAISIANVARRASVVVMAMMLCGFTTLIVMALRQGRRPPCACFGRYSRPVGWGSVARNAGLLALAAVALIG